MTLSKTSVKAALVAALSDPDAGDDVKSALDKYSEKFPDFFGVTKVQEAAKVEAFLSQDPEDWTLEKLQRVAVWLRDNWEDIPE